MTNKYDLETQVWRTGTASLSTNIGGLIAADKTRFLTYIRVERLGGAEINVGSDITNIEMVVASRTTGATDLADDYTASIADFGKLLVKMASLATGGVLLNLNDRLLKNEVQGTIENPILSVASSRYMILARPQGASASVFAQYYDE